MAIRNAFFLVAFVNLLYFAWMKGNVDASEDGHEPQRLEQQLEPEKLHILREGEEPPAKKVEMACRLVSGLTLAEAEALKVAMTAEGGETKILPVAQPTVFQVVIPELVNKPLADKKLVELNGLGVEGHTAVALEDGHYAILLGSFASDAAAQEFLLGLGKRGVKSARVDAHEVAAVKAGAETRGPAATLLQQLPKLIAPFADATIGECVP